MAWLWWIGAALVLGVIETLTVDLTFLMFAGGAVGGAIAAALVLAIPMARLAQRVRWARGPLVTGASLLYAVPSLCLFVVLPIVLGTRIYDPVNVVVALTLYGLALLVPACVDALDSADWFAAAREVYQKKYSAPATTPQERAKRQRFMAQRGFSYEEIQQAMTATQDEA